jgi:hypothetical protein
MSDNLLEDLRSLRAKARQDRHGYAFSLLLFGALILAAPLVYAPSGDEDFPYASWDPRVQGSNPLVRIFRTEADFDPASPTLVAVYWLLVLVVGFGATVWWYRRRATRIGVETDTRAFLVAACSGSVGVFLGTYSFSDAAMRLYGAWQANLTIILASAALAGLSVWWCVRRPATRVFAVFAASVFGAVTFSAIGVYANRGYSALLVIAAGLLALAWLERSTLLGVVGVLFTLAAIPTTIALSTPFLRLDTSGLFFLVGWQTDYHDLRLRVLQNLFLPGMVLLVGGTIAAVKARR